MVAGLAGAGDDNLMGWPVFVTWTISETELLGSGMCQSHILFTNPKYMHIAQDGNIEMAVSTERYFDAAQTAVRAVQHEDFGFAPAQGLVTRRERVHPELKSPGDGGASAVLDHPGWIGGFGGTPAATPRKQQNYRTTPSQQPSRQGR